jgi:hypothetical protein
MRRPGGDAVSRMTVRLAVLVLVASLFPRDVAAVQETLLGTPITPEPGECTVAPRPVDSLIRIGASATTGLAGTEINSEMDPATLPTSGPADGITTAGVVAVVRHYIACLNALDTVRSFALFTDSYLAKILYDYGPLPGLVLSAGQIPAVLPVEAWRSFAVSSVGLLPDGRATAVVNILNPTSDSGFPPGHLTKVTYLLAHVDGAWLIDMVAVEPGNRPNEVVSGNTFTGVIFNMAMAEQLVQFFGDSERYERYWQPTRRHIVALEAALLPYLESQSQALAVRVAYEGYGRQYAGAIQGGQPLIILNAFCDTDNLGWLATPYVVDDGGNCYFSVRWDVSTGTFFELRINGEA